MGFSPEKPYLSNPVRKKIKRHVQPELMGPLMCKQILATLCLAFLIYPMAVQAEFSMLNPGPADLENARSPEVTASGLSGRVAFPKALGFGSQVPLAFAARQIVPPGVTVRYGPGADPALLVDWRGGAPWDQVLKASVAPGGLHIVVTWHAVQIRK